MVLLQPCQHVFPKLFGKGQQFRGIVLSRRPRHVVLDGVAFDSAGFKIRGVLFSLVAQDQRQSCQRAKVLQRFLWAKAGGVEQDRTELQRRVVGNAELPVGGDFTLCVFKIAIDDGQQTDDFLRAGLMRAEPAVFRPVF